MCVLSVLAVCALLLAAPTGSSGSLRHHRHLEKTTTSKPPPTHHRVLSPHQHHDSAHIPGSPTKVSLPIADVAHISSRRDSQRPWGHHHYYPLRTMTTARKKEPVDEAYGDEYYDNYDDDEEDVDEVENEADDSSEGNDYVDDQPSYDWPDRNREVRSQPSRSLTEEKWANYGTPDAVKKSHLRYSQSEYLKVRENIDRLLTEGQCKVPRPKIIQLNAASKRYKPHCTVLHRCGDDTGCCDSDSKTCVASKTEFVDLHFYMFPLGATTPVVEVLTFTNHTECHCAPRLTTIPIRDDFKRDNQLTDSGESRRCKCPSFYANTGGNGNCRCDCEKNSEACQKQRDGKEGFSIQDRGCIANGLCSMPTCTFGKYSTETGRCPGLRHIKRNASHFRT